MTTGPSLHQLREVVQTCPIIDNHAHNLLRVSQLKTADLLSITSEAEGDALQDHPAALPHLRALRQLRQLYGLPDDADWDAIRKRRRELLDTDPHALIRTCLQRTHTVLIDDGLDGSFEPYNWHDQFTTSKCKRIVRIEAVAADILHAMHQQAKLPVGVAIADEDACSVAWVEFITAFEQAIAAFILDDQVAGFKSVVCYRTGLDVHHGRDIDITDRGLRSFRKYFLPHCTRTAFRVESKGMNDALVISTCKLIDADYRNNAAAKPLQFHTGLGDNDITLLDSNPACLQPLIKHYPHVPIVLLHSSYPYTREAGYLATVYKNVYLDIGEVFPMVSRDGQEHIVRQALEITPTSKILWSTDGHHHPETYWLANIQGRDAIEKILCEYVEHEDLTPDQAIQAAKDILFENSNALYSLGLQLPSTEDIPTLASATKDLHVASATPTVSPSAPAVSALSHSIFNRPRSSHNIEYVFVQWLDYMAQMRSRWVPLAEFKRLQNSGPIRFAISRGNLGTTQNDHMSAVCIPVGAIYVEPDLKSLRPMQATGTIKNAATVMSRFVDDAGDGLAECPRATLQLLSETLERENDIHLLVGFEIEINFCRRNVQTGDGIAPFGPLDEIHNWGTLSDQQYITALPLMTSIASELQRIGIAIQQLHSEAGAGQYEFVLPPLPPVEAVDTLIQAKQCIQQMAANQGLRATCHPMPFPGIGTAAHAHISLNSSNLEAGELEKIEMSFMASVLAHISSICAITMPQPVSYGRVVDDSWTGGTWVAWGTNNREAPLRRVVPGRWEVRCLDGLANMYLALSAIIGAGLGGIKEGLEMQLKDCNANPTKLSNEEKQKLGITERMPRTLEESLARLEGDGQLKGLVGKLLIDNWIPLKKAEQEMLNEMEDGERRVWLMERY